MSSAIGGLPEVVTYKCPPSTRNKASTWDAYENTPFSPMAFSRDLKDIVRQRLFQEVISRKNYGDSTAKSPATAASTTSAASKVVGRISQPFNAILQSSGLVGQADSLKDLRVLIVDKNCVRILSAVLQMNVLVENGITLVENITKIRKPFPFMDAIYLVAPDEFNIASIMADFDVPGMPMYRACHIYFSETCPKSLFEALAKSKAPKYIKTLKELNLNFMPWEAQVFSTESDAAFLHYFNPALAIAQEPVLDELARRIADVCALLGEYPRVRYRRGFSRNVELAEKVQKELDDRRKADSSMGRSPEKHKSVLVILDRGFDCVSPFIHEMTYQAILKDLLNPEGNVHKYTMTDGQERQVVLDESDDLWMQLRHEHIAVVSKKVSEKFRNFKEKKNVQRLAGKGDNVGAKELSRLIKEMPEYQKELNNYITHLNLVEMCMSVYEKRLAKLCKIQQDLATGYYTDGEQVRSKWDPVLAELPSENLTNLDKVRLISLYAAVMPDTCENLMTRLLRTAKFEQSFGRGTGEDHRPYNRMVRNLAYMGHRLVPDHSQHVKKPAKMQSLYKHKRIKRPNVSTFDTARWIPVVKDIMEEAIEGKLDDILFPAYPREGDQQLQQFSAASVRSGATTSSNADPSPTTAPSKLKNKLTWLKQSTLGVFKKNKEVDKRDSLENTYVYGSARYATLRAAQAKYFPRLIIFVVGGIFMSEVRSAYEVTKAVDGKWQVVIGSTELLSPEQYLERMANLSGMDPPFKLPS